MWGQRMISRSSIADCFNVHFSHQPELVVRAPGRVELIGGHTDYNDGYVLPLAIEHSCWAASAARDDQHVRVYSATADAVDEFDISADIEKSSNGWSNYVRGVAAMLARKGCRLTGADIYVDSDVPIGGGLSSSAALEIAIGKTLVGLASEYLELTELALLARQAEHDYAGTPCGIMDQFICVLGQKDHALLLDCRTQEYQHVPFPDSAAVLVANSGVKHQLAESEYGLRQQQCHDAVAYFAGIRPDIRALRDVTEQMVRTHASQMEPVQAARAAHVVGENARVQALAAALQRNDLAAAGEQMSRSHVSLRDQYQVSCAELDFLVESVLSYDGVYGSRMSGGGFGGCTVTLVDRDHAQNVAEKLSEAYEQEYGRRCETIITTAAAGAEVC